MGLFQAWGELRALFCSWTETEKALDIRIEMDTWGTDSNSTRTHGADRRYTWAISAIQLPTRVEYTEF